VIGDKRLANGAAGQAASIRRPITDVMIAEVRYGSIATQPDSLATKEPIEIRIHRRARSRWTTTTTRTPCGDFELAAGLLYGEGLLRSTENARAIRYCDNLAEAGQLYNVVAVELKG
jgi:FdhD protein